MNRGPRIEDAVARATRSNDARIAAVRDLAEALQSAADVRDEGERKLASLREQVTLEVSAAEAAGVKAHRAALSAGWTPEELRKIGFTEPDKQRRARGARRTEVDGASKSPDVRNREAVSA